MAITRMFTIDELEAIDIPMNCVWDEIIDTGRWSTYHTGVFEYQGAHWQIDWQEPATEQQECDQWYDETEVEAVKVVLLPVVMKKWVPASE